MEVPLSLCYDHEACVLVSSHPVLWSVTVAAHIFETLQILRSVTFNNSLMTLIILITFNNSTTLLSDSENIANTVSQGGRYCTVSQDAMTLLCFHGAFHLNFSLQKRDMPKVSMFAYISTL